MKTELKPTLAYDYAKLDEYLTKITDPHSLDQDFRGFHTAFTHVLQLLVCTREMQDLFFTPEETNARTLDEFFQILGQLQKKGGES